MNNAERILRIEETKRNLIETINTSGLSAYDLVPVMDALTQEIKALASQEMQNAYKAMAEQKNEETSESQIVEVEETTETEC